MSEPPIDRADVRRIYARGLRTVRREHSDSPLAGEVPAALCGTLYRNGGGRFERGGEPYGHSFDGDGHIVRLQFADGGVRYTNRFVRTEGYRAEEAADRILFRGFGTNRPGGICTNLLRMRFKNAANTNIVWQGGKLLALWEGGLPYRLHPQTLATLGTDDFGGQLQNHFSPIDRLLNPHLPFSAHPTLDGDGSLFNFGIALGGRTRLLRYRVDPDGQLEAFPVYPLQRMSFVHDAVVTPHYWVFLLPRADFDIPRALAGLKTPVASLQLHTEHPMELLLMPRFGGPSRRIPTIPGFVFHFAQGFEDDHGHVVLDICRAHELTPLDDVDALVSGDPNRVVPRLERLTVDPTTETFEHTRWSDRGTELPRVLPGPIGVGRRLIFSVGSPPDRPVPLLSTVQRLDTHTGELRAREFFPELPGEPIPVADPQAPETPRWLLVLVFEADEPRTDLHVLDADTLETISRLPLPEAVPPGFHGNWVPDG